MKQDGHNKYTTEKSALQRPPYKQNPLKNTEKNVWKSLLANLKTGENSLKTCCEAMTSSTRVEQTADAEQDTSKTNGRHTCKQRQVQLTNKEKTTSRQHNTKHQNTYDE